MNEKIQDNLISAYHDAELSAAERADVERLLASSPEARAELESYRRLSGLLRESGRPTLTADLAPLVMHSIERQMLLPQTVSRPLATPRSTNWAGALVALTAAMMVAVSLMPQGNRDRQFANRHQAPVMPQNVVAQPGPNSLQPLGGHAVAANDTVKPATKPDQTPANPVVAPQLAASDLPLNVIEDLKKANFGEIVRFLKNSGKDVTVFHLMVLDVQPGLESLQLILSAQQISGPMNQPSQSGVVAVYVQANQNQLDKVIAELMSKDREQFIALAVPPLPVKASEVQKLMTGKPENVASSQMPMQQNELSKLGVNAVQSKQILAAREGRNVRFPGSSFSVKTPGRDNSPNRKVLIVLEKVPAELMPKPATPHN